MKKFNYKKSLGQNFLKDNNIISKISKSINPTKNDLVVEIGPGDGAITKELVKKDCNIICFEIDERLKIELNKIESKNLKVIFNDFLNINLSNYIDEKNYNHIYFIGNLPYYITTAIIKKIINESNPYEIIVMVQKEVGDRIMAHPNSKEYGSLSVFLQYRYTISEVTKVSKTCFEPVPKVDSIVIKFQKNDKYSVINFEKFNKLILDAFSHKRKNIKNNLKDYDLEKIEKVLIKNKKDLTYRAESLSIKEFVELSNELFPE